MRTALFLALWGSTLMCWFILDKIYYHILGSIPMCMIPFSQVWLHYGMFGSIPNVFGLNAFFFVAICISGPISVSLALLYRIQCVQPHSYGCSLISVPLVPFQCVRSHSSVISPIVVCLVSFLHVWFHSSVIVSLCYLFGPIASCFTSYLCVTHCTLFSVIPICHITFYAVQSRSYASGPIPA